MYKRIILTLLWLGVFITGQGINIDGKDRHPIIIDTDCAFDDMRAMGLLLSRPEIRIKGIVVTEGTLLPDEGVKKVRSLLHAFGLDSIPLAAGRLYNKTGPAWRDINRSFIWSTWKTSDVAVPDAQSWLKETLASGQDKITYVCLGPLSTLSETLIKHKELSGKLFRVLWYNEDIQTPAGFNYLYDKPSADLVLGLNIRMDIISDLEYTDAAFDTSLYKLAAKNTTTLARLLADFGSQPSILEDQNRHHLQISDELAAIYLINPELFDMKTKPPRLHVRYNIACDIESVKEVYTDVISGIYECGENVVFLDFPDEPRMYTYDVRKMMDEALRRHGHDEWKACVMTDEFHGHLGVFSLVGAKMGIRAREIFGVGPDQLMVLSFAGTKPPYSCLNDGIQVSTGATIGQGLITLSEEKPNRPQAVFTFNKKSIRLTLKEEYLTMINRDIEEGIVQFGLADDGYWKLVRRSALKYWLEWDRNEIFIIEEILN
jgi:pyrimidine-specific ribonucleoside hydrolase